MKENQNSEVMPTQNKLPIFTWVTDHFYTYPHLQEKSFNIHVYTEEQKADAVAELGKWGFRTEISENRNSLLVNK